MKKLFVGILMIMVMVVGMSLTTEAKSIGKVEKKEILNPDDIQIKNWVGLKFMFLEKHKTLQSYGYQDLSFNPKKLYSKHPTYDKWVDKVITVESITPGGSCFIIKFDYKGKKIYAKSCGNNVDGIILLQDLENAKNRWIGKTIYSKKGLIETYDGKGKEGETCSKINVLINEPLKVINVIPTMIGSSRTCIWVVVETSEQKVGYLGIAYSWTNQYIKRYTNWSKYPKERPWMKVISEFNPQEKFSWSDEMCQKISEKKISLGMTKQQVIWSWGKPKSIHKGIYKGSMTEQWVYSSSSYVYFDGGSNKVTAIQN